MSTLAFDSDYMEGAHPAIMARMMETSTLSKPRLWHGPLLCFGAREDPQGVRDAGRGGSLYGGRHAYQHHGHRWAAAPA